MQHCFLLARCLWLGAFLSVAEFTAADDSIPAPVDAQRGWSTVALGGLMPTTRQLRQMLTLTGSCYGEDVSWDAAVGKTTFHILRWKLAD